MTSARIVPTLPFRVSSLVDLVRARAERTPDQTLYLFLEEGGWEEQRITLGEFDRRARAIAQRLQALGAEGERAVLLFAPGADYISAFFGCLYAGVVAVPAYPPDPTRLGRSLPRLQAIAADAGARFVLTTSFIASMAESVFEIAPDMRAMHWLATDELEHPEPDAWRDLGLGSDRLAFLQYTSGSTGTPKGVRLNHGNLLHNLELIARAFETSEASKGVIWLPPYHDMGLIGGLLQPLYRGFPAVMMSPLDFLSRPLRWLQAISRHGGTVSGGPNFAFDLCVRKTTPEERAELDLSTWKVAFSGAEPIRPETLDRFCEAFAGSGFRREAFYPCYGLAEATLLVSGSQPGQAPLLERFDAKALERGQVEPRPEGGRELVGCGKVREGLEVLIVDPEQRTRCAPGRIGEVWVTGGSVAEGYWGKTVETERQFQARLDDGSGPYLRTGDLGFFRGPELFISGRLKDLLIIRGRNHYPQDIEYTVERSHPALRPGCCAAFSVEVEGEERLVVAQEVDLRKEPNLEEVGAAIRRAVQEAHELHVHVAVLLKPGRIPKTTSGKIQRHASRQGFLEGTLDELGRSQILPGAAQEGVAEVEAEQVLAATGDERTALLTAHLQTLLSRALGAPGASVDPDRPVHELGLDSLMALEVAHALERGLGLRLSLQALLEDVSPRQLAARLAAMPLAPAPLAPVPEAGQRTVSHGQESLWFLHQMNPESAAYNLFSAVRIRSSVDAEALRAAFEALSRRHPVLRTVYPARDGMPTAQVLDGPVDFTRVEARGLTDEALKTLVSDEAHRPFDLERGPVFRVRLYTRTDGESVLLLAVHHIAADLWSLVVLLSELRQLYPAAREQRALELPVLPASYADHVRWQEAFLAGAEGERQRAYWRERLAGELPVLSLPMEGARPSVVGSAGAAHRFLLDPKLTSALKALAREEGTTLFTVLLAGFQVLLSRLSGQREVLVGSPVAGRSLARFGSVVGYFVNPLVLRADLSGSPTFREFLGQLRHTVLGALEHPDVPFDQLVKELKAHRDASRSPLVQAMFVLEKPHARTEASIAGFVLGDEGAEADLGGLHLSAFPVVTRTAPFELSLRMAEVGEGLSGALEYSTELYAGAKMEEMVRQLVGVLEQGVAQPGERVGKLALVTHEERQQLLKRGLGGPGKYPGEASIGQVFEQAVAWAPQAVAVTGGGKTLTYAELNRRAEQVARRLKAEGVGPEQVVGLLMERSVDLVEAMVGVVKAGCTYLALDPKLPAERLEYMLKDSGTRVVVTQAEWKGLAEGEGRDVVVLEEGAFAAEGGWAPVEVSAQAVAYVMYTSGSTGRPKGVAVTHQGVVRLVRESNYAAFSPDDVFLHWNTMMFDASTFEVWGALLNGARLVVSPPGLPSLADVARLIAEQGVNTVLATAALFQQLVDHQLEGLRPLKNLLAGGDAMPPVQAKRLLDTLPKTRLINAYGPTENAVITTCHTLQPGYDARTRVPLGVPLDGTDVYVLDEEMQPVPEGVVGELYTGGDGLARGYVGRPELTAEKFVPNPYGKQAGQRLYRTGDLARWRGDGSLEFVGRADTQVKVRGFRIEIGEVEGALESHPEVKAAAVVVQGEGAEGKRLVGFVVGGGRKVEVGEVRGYLEKRLPEYMVPSLLVEVEKLPLTGNGKVDRKALLAQVSEQGAGASSNYVAPRDETEQKLAKLWEELLGRGRVGIHDDFFEAGGHSLLATRLVARVQETFGVTLPIRTLFESRTVASLARAVSRPEQAASAPRSEIKRISRDSHRIKLSQLKPSSGSKTGGDSQS
ncbi:non-ribosomal peptide synthetase [Stigmatella aurantiaca]|nr:non-ribosomal peptide synthetase [Stigmatella aurantiaca]